MRALARDGFLALATEGVTLPEVPVPVLDLAELDTTGMLTKALGARPGEIWLVRPDAYVAAVLTDPADLPGALWRALGSASTR